MAYDTEMTRLDVRKPQPDSLWRNHAMAAWNKLYMFSSDSHSEGEKPHYLCKQRALREFGRYNSDEDKIILKMRGQIKVWAWKSIPSPLPWPLNGSVRDHPSCIQSYAVHPDGHTIFASCYFGSSSGGKCHPFTFSLGAEDSESKHHCMWRLPFDGRAYYDNDLDVWFGI
jgi:hypothetical protein